MYEIREDMEKIRTLRKIEIVDLQRASATFKKSVLTYAKPL